MKICPDCESTEIEDVDFGFPLDSKCKDCGLVFDSTKN